MICSTLGEFRGEEKKVSKNGNEYYIYRFEELESGKPFEMLCDIKANVSKGSKCNINFTYATNQYGSTLRVNYLEMIK